MGMRVILQRVSEARVTEGGQVLGEIGRGLLVLLGVEAADGMEDVEWLAGKVAKIRIFDDGEGKMNQSVGEVGGEILVVSQFTLHAATKKGNRPSFIKAAPPAISEPLYEAFCHAVGEESQVRVATGRFGGDMKVGLVNDGPVTIFIDSRARE